MNKEKYLKALNDFLNQFTSLLEGIYGALCPLTEKQIEIISESAVKDAIKTRYKWTNKELYNLIVDFERENWNYEYVLNDWLIPVGPEYNRRAVECDYGLDNGELDGVSIYRAIEIVGEEEGALDRYLTKEE